MEVASVTITPISAAVEPVACKSSFSDCLSSYLSQHPYEGRPSGSRSKPESKSKPVSLAAGEPYRPGALLDVEA